MSIKQKNPSARRGKLSAAISLALSVGYAGGALAQEAAHAEDEIVEIVVSAPFLQSEAETALPVGILSGEALREKLGNSLGETLQNEIGVASASFGTGVGQPVIRGQSGNRVKILQNGVGVTDASSVSPDHAHGVNSRLAERLEVVRGPSALLYGSGAIGGNFGFSFVGDNGFFGVSISEVEKDYGLPLGVHTHTHGEEHEEEHEDDHDDDHDDDHEEHEEEVEFVRVLMEKTRYDFKGELRLDGGFIENIRANVGITDYLHDEVEVFADGGRETGTGYFNEGNEGRVTLSHVPVGNWTGVWGMQFSNTEFSAIGEEAFIPHSDLDSTGFFGVERYNGGNWTGELGIRFEDSSVDPNGRCEYSGNTTSLSGSVLYELEGDANLLFGASRSRRAPTVEELYSNVSADSCEVRDHLDELVLHASTNLLEIGNPMLEEETSNNLEFGFRQYGGGFTGEFSAYYNQIDNFIFLDLSGEEFEEQPLASYLARDASFTGIEGEITFNLMESDDSSLAFGVFGDLVNAEFDSGGNVPRIPAAKLGAELRWFGENWSVHLHATRVREQDDVAELELPTNAYTLVSLYADYHWDVGDDSSLEVFLRGKNLLDEEIRNHVSFLKNHAPEPGRGVMLGVRFEY